MKPRTASWLLLVVMAVGCSDPVGPDEQAPRLLSDEATPGSFSAWLLRGSSEPIPDRSVEGGVGEIIFEGTIGTPYPCYNVQAVVDRTDATIEFTIVATRRPTGCVSVLAAFGYRGTLGDLPPGPYVVLINHTVGDHSYRVLETSVTVE